ncbi:MAG: nucleotide exchange factor GrpE [Erysipelotrichaceae bacterium]|nr:nucleotide exchange factor GrpE [Erysipelotrichaceae bacterium]
MAEKKKKKKETVSEEEVIKEETVEEAEVPQTEEVKEEEAEEEIVEDINEESETERLNKEIEKLKNDYARAYADTENLRKRLNAEAEQARKYRIQSFAREILPVIDNLERALATEVHESDESFKKGIEMTYNQLISALKNEGVEEIDCLNKPFDPNLEQAIMQEKKEDTEAGTVIEVLQKGYVLKDRILRPAMVKVSE